MLVIIRGLPYSGKSTYAKTHYPNMVHLENDMYFYRDGKYNWEKDKLPNAIDWCYSTTELSLAREVDVVVSNTFIKNANVDSYVWLAKQYNVPYKVIRLNNFYDYNDHNVPIEVYNSMVEDFEDYPGEEIINQ